MAVYDIDGNELKVADSFDNAVTIKPVDVGGDTIVEFNGDGGYYFNPYTASTSLAGWYFYDENKQPLPVYDSSETVVNRMDLSGSAKGRWILNQRDVLVFNGTQVTVKTYISYDDLVADIDRGNVTYHTNVIPTYMRVSGRVTYDIYSDTALETGLFQVHYNNEKYLGFFEQIDDYIQQNAGNSMLNLTSSFGKKFVQSAVYQLNQTRDALRIGTFNVYSAGHAQTNWDCIKNELMDFGLDLCAFQEVRDPLNTSGTNKVWADEMTSWQFPYASSNGTLHPINTRTCLSKYPVVSSSETEFSSWTSDKRCLAKYEIQLPAHQDRVGSEQLKLSVYNTQLEVDSSSARISEAQEIIAAMATDTNPFVMICMDSNDFSDDKEIWQMFEDAGYTLCINPMSQTTTAQNDIIDQIFVNENMKGLNCEVVNSWRYPFRKYTSTTPVAVSDHDLCFADIQFLYDKICCVKQTLTHVTSDFDRNAVQKGEPVTIHFAAESGYTITNTSIKMGALWMSQAEGMTWENNTLTVTSVTGDLNIIITATAS